jgi:hypothetical protein
MFWIILSSAACTVFIVIGCAAIAKIKVIFSGRRR